MNNKSYLRTIGYAFLGVLTGIFISWLVDVYREAGDLEIGNIVKNILSSGLNYIQLTLIITMIVPAVLLLLRGKKLLKSIESPSSDEFEIIENKGKRAIDIAITLNTLSMILSFILLGISYSGEIKLRVLLIALIIFIFISICNIIIDFKSIKIIQMSDDRIKGDPSRLNFHKEYIESCDEAEQFKIYKSAYRSFPYTKYTTPYNC